MKKFIALALAALMLLSLAACGNDTPTQAPTQKPAETTKAADTTTEAAAPAETKDSSDATKAPAASEGEWETKGLPAVTAGCLDGKILIMSVGQSADVDLVCTPLKRAKIDYYQNNLIEADGVTDSYKILICVVGGSNKGLGAASMDQADEEKRVTGVLEKAKSLGLTIVCIHNGGVDRRGTLSDAFIKLAFPEANYAIVLNSSDTDNLIHDILAAKSTPTAYVEKASECVTVLKYMLGK
jgi:predicted small lipoprotein YifL